MKKVVGKRRGEILIKCALAAAVGLLLIMLVQSFLENPAEVNAAEPEITLYSKDNKVPVYQAGKEETWILEVTNHTEQDILGARIFPEMGNSSDSFTAPVLAVGNGITIRGRTTGGSSASRSPRPPTVWKIRSVSS